MIAPPQLSGFSALEQTAVEHARVLWVAMQSAGVSELDARLELADPPGGGQTFVVAIAISRSLGLVNIRVLTTRVELALDDLDRPDLFETPDGHLFAGAGDAAAAPISEGGRENAHSSARGEGRT